MRIAYILPSLRNQGPIVVAKRLSDCLVEWGCIIDVYYFDEVLSPMTFKCPVMQISMKERIDFDSYDIIHSHCMRPDMYLAKWKKHIHKAKIISTLHQDTYRTFCYQYNPVLSYVFTRYWCHVQSKFDGVISISKQLENAYKKFIKTPITTIYNGCTILLDETFDRDIVMRIKTLRAKYKVLGTYAYITRGKGLNQIIRSLVNLCDYAFVIIGEGPDVEHLKQMSRKLGVTDRVFFFPYQKNPCNYLPYFDIYVMPSYSEGFGLAMVEAALAGKSIVCSDIPSFHEIFPHNEVSFFRLDDSSSLENAIQLAFRNRKENGESARLWAEQNFTIAQMSLHYLNYYETILD